MGDSDLGVKLRAICESATANLQESQKLAQKKVEGREKSEKSESVKSGKSEKPKRIGKRLEKSIFGPLNAYFNAISWENVYFLKRYT